MNSFDPNAEDEFIYCNVVVFEEIIQRGERSFYTAQKALCLLSSHRYFEVYASMLNVILNLYKLERFTMLQRDFQAEVSFARAETEEALLRELTAATKVATVLPEMTQVLREFYGLSPLQGVIEFKNQNLRCHISQRIPQTLREQ